MWKTLSKSEGHNHPYWDWSKSTMYIQCDEHFFPNYMVIDCTKTWQGK